MSGFDFHPLIDGQIRYLVPPEQHPKGKYGNYGADILVEAGTVIYCPVDLTIPKVYVWDGEAAPKGSRYFTGKFAPLVHGNPAVRFWFGPILPDDGVLTANGTFHRKQVKGAVLGVSSTIWFHIGCNNGSALQDLLP